MFKFTLLDSQKRFVNKFYMLKILITGSGGQLGQELCRLQITYPNWNFLAPDRSELDITDKAQVEALFSSFRPDYCLNTAAYTAVDRAEEEREKAFAINAIAAQHIAATCRKLGTHLIHYSTDYVYQSGIDRPLREDDPTQPDGVYAASKLKGDQLVLSTFPLATVVRTSWVYSSFGHNFVKTMLRLGKERDELRVVFDQIGTPTYAHDLASFSLQLIHQLERKTIAPEETAGIFHYSNEGVCSWYDFALAIFELSGISCEVSPIESKEYPTPASRPHFSVLNKAKVKAVTGTTIRHWRTALSACLEAIKDEK